MQALADKHRKMLAEIGYPGSGSSAGNLVEPHPKNDVPSLKKRQRIVLDEEIDKDEEDKMPSAALARKDYLRRKAGKSGGLQTF